jgi:hypothetical protein
MSSRLFSRAVTASVVAIACAACTSNDGDSANSSGGVDQPSLSILFSSATKRVVVEVDYVPGAQPYTGAAGRLGDVWSIFRENADLIFDGQKEIVVPSQLGEMQQLDDVAMTDVGMRDLLAIAAKHRDHRSAGDTVTLYVLFVNGRFKEDDGTVKNEAVGVSLDGKGIIGMFKPVIASSALRGSVTPRFVEQSTLVHEFGHAIGLVNKGIPLTRAHQDEEHGHHCVNSDCVMYWTNEGARDAADFVRTYLETGHRLLFGPDCLADVKAFREQVD